MLFRESSADSPEDSVPSLPDSAESPEHQPATDPRFPESPEDGGNSPAGVTESPAASAEGLSDAARALLAFKQSRLRDWWTSEHGSKPRKRPMWAGGVTHQQ